MKKASDLEYIKQLCVRENGLAHEFLLKAVNLTKFYRYVRDGSFFFSEGERKFFITDNENGTG